MVVPNGAMDHEIHLVCLNSLQDYNMCMRMRFCPRYLLQKFFALLFFFSFFLLLLSLLFTQAPLAVIVRDLPEI